MASVIDQERNLLLSGGLQGRVPCFCSAILWAQAGRGCKRSEDGDRLVVRDAAESTCRCVCVCVGAAAVVWCLAHLSWGVVQPVACGCAGSKQCSSQHLHQLICAGLGG